MAIKDQLNNQTEMPIVEHLEELREKFIISAIILISITTICFLEIKHIIYILQQPANGIKFLQLAPGEYLFSSIKVAIYTGLLISFPAIAYQLISFILPGLTRKEIKYILPLIISSITLFFTGIIFSYKVLVPAAIRFLINYGSDVIEPIWSLEEYFNFIILLLLTTGISFQVPVIQIILGLMNIISSKQMLKYWKYTIFIATIFGAIVTPSTDPITQIFISSAVLFLYLIGCIILKFLNK
uniref:Sec-independent protein translocase component TatC n=1 Tax=Antithamnionella ternifolia TaxID=207919 RepID=A0A4D6WKC8_9FLOR|nr:Sec-independent protein translocase component TatC [Antithamnionella ternifolia]